MPAENNQKPTEEDQLISNIKKASLQITSFVFIAIGFIFSSNKDIAYIAAVVRFASFALLCFLISFGIAIYFEHPKVRKATEQHRILKNLHLTKIMLFFFNLGIPLLGCAIWLLLTPLETQFIFPQGFTDNLVDLLTQPSVLIIISVIFSLIVTIAIIRVYKTTEDTK